MRALSTEIARLRVEYNQSDQRIKDELEAQRVAAGNQDNDGSCSDPDCCGD